MASNTSAWWTDEKVDITVTSRYVHSHLRPNEAEQLTKSVFGDLSDNTYLEWILTRSKRFFLTLVEAGVPDQIFGIIDDSWDDEDLPIPEDEVSNLLLSAEPDKTLDRRFYRAQFKYLIRIIGDGEHIRYAQEETIPVNPLGTKLVLGKGKDGLDKVKLPSDPRRVFARKRVVLKTHRMEAELLTEMADWRSFAHEHVLSIFGSYTTNDQLHVLMTPAAEYSLKSFLTDTPKSFEVLAKSERRRITLQWSHCLANGLAWLHGNGKHHGAIRPSRIHVDEHYRIFLGQFDGTGILCDDTVKNDIEAYQYAAPERWKRSVVVQATGNSRTALPSGGRTGRRMTAEVERSSSRAQDQDQDQHESTGSLSLNLARPTSVSYVFNPTSKTGSRLRLGSTKNALTKLGSTLRQTESRQTNHTLDTARPTRISLEDRARPGASPVLSSSSSDRARSRRQGGPIYAASREMRTAVVQTWASAQHDQLAADVFSLGAILMDILTPLCKHTYSSFARHRASKNKSAGRGGGLADASFHANIGQVFSWADVLQKDAEKRIKKEDGSIFKAVGPILQVVLQCLEREPTERLHASDLKRKLCDHIRDFASLNVAQCCLNSETDQFEDRPQSRGVSVDIMRHTSKHPTQRNEARENLRNDGQQAQTSAIPAVTPRLKSLRISPANLNMFNFGVNDGNDTTLIGSDQHAGPKPQERPDSFAFATGEGVEVFPRPPTAASTVTSKRRLPTIDTSDQAQSFPGSAAPRVNFQTPPSAPASTIGATEDFQSVYSYTPPPTAHPTRDLPPIPRSAHSKTPPGGIIHPTRSTSRIPPHQPQSQQSPPSISEPTALQSLPTTQQNTNNNFLDTNNSTLPTPVATTHSNRNGTQPRRAPSRMDERNEITEITPIEPQAQNQRLYRSSSRAGVNENRMYVSHLGRDKMALRGLQYP